ncbi:Uncharacterised protein [uncultured Ruminococcus sp.]|uniref:hypothetical protein n=1 Tax=Pseudoruminococcus massiliensis TaxID=2086583 RepID=UPI000820FC2D|nr:Uncharacterised protein [uncultured Ruminococcus sp.]
MINKTKQRNKLACEASLNQLTRSISRRSARSISRRSARSISRRSARSISRRSARSVRGTSQSSDKSNPPTVKPNPTNKGGK